MSEKLCGCCGTSIRSPRRAGGFEDLICPWCWLLLLPSSFWLSGVGLLEAKILRLFAQACERCAFTDRAGSPLEFPFFQSLAAGGSGLSSSSMLVRFARA